MVHVPAATKAAKSCGRQRAFARTLRAAVSFPLGVSALGGPGIAACTTLWSLFSSFLRHDPGFFVADGFPPGVEVGELLLALAILAVSGGRCAPGVEGEEGVGGEHGCGDEGEPLFGCHRSGSVLAGKYRRHLHPGKLHSRRTPPFLWWIILPCPQVQAFIFLGVSAHEASSLSRFRSGDVRARLFFFPWSWTPRKNSGAPR